MTKKDEGKSTSKGVGKSKLTDKQQRFVEEYLIDLNATQAAIRAGYSADTARQIGAENLSKLVIQEAIQEAQNKRAERVNVTQDDVLKGLLEIISMSTGKQKITETELSKVDGSIVPMDVEKVCFEPHAANKALELLGKHLGMFKDKVDVTNSDGSLRPTVIELVAPNENTA
ncbi:terminase small subunit [Glaesserella parasuis]|uniref:terminase small subunit n=1 Tax=Glaesserella parasuis TaxID=738 RepID=UPI00038E931C|nr:terminase small subunit [Glaesserella parasuis]ATW45515.1 terminase [Glaesserella parasuis str. Nagasaki]AWY45435.1 terminase small subunit [Glaesserella parasuis 29755]EQA03571.1 terminase small subunit [Glaesserella parasuis str. Nagasaki]EQA96070.1 terminase small subunit [Glaesserella parasuis 29755]EYE73213.1 bacteriophage terminase small subunit [Glaesserella parasuis str. Nagasaki]